MRIPIVVLSMLCAPTALAADPVSPAAPWARRASDDVVPRAAQAPIPAADLDGLASHWEGDMLFTPDGMPADAFRQLGREPLPAMAYEPTTGILYLAMDGVVLSPNCGNGDGANAALNCSPLVDQETNFPAYGNGSAQAALFQELASFYEPFNLVMTSDRPPDWLPYTMAVVGGSAGLAGQPGGVCGVANVACDGLKRNHVSLTFPESCGGVAETAAQETSHNWGLEHVNDQGDLMYPFNNGGFKSFKNECNAIDHSTGGAITQCTYIHEIYCPAGGGEQQNAYEELMAAFGPREEDSTPPEIIDIQPPDGSQFTNDEDILITANVSENSNFLGAKWTWIEGLPEDMDEYTVCTNNVCTADFDLATGSDPNEIQWDMVNLSGAPVGTYSFHFEVMDAYGNYDDATITIEVVDGMGGVDETGSATDASDGGTDAGDSDGGSNATNDDGDDGDDDGGGGEDGSGSASVGMEGPGGPERGCNCRSDGSLPGLAAWLVPVLAIVRRRRAA